jgi:hypothetical protein
VPTDSGAAVIEQWYRREPESTRTLIESLPPGARRDTSAECLIQKAHAAKPDGAAEWL